MSADWGGLVLAMLEGEPRARDVARWRAIEATAHEIRGMVPREPANEDGSPATMPNEVALHLGLGGSELVDALASNGQLAKDLCRWRLAVTDAEALNARSLLVLADSVCWLAALLSRGPKDPERVSGVLDVLGTWVNRTWNTDVPFNADLRAWSIRMTRRYDLLPVGMRIARVRS